MENSQVNPLSLIGCTLLIGNEVLGALQTSVSKDGNLTSILIKEPAEPESIVSQDDKPDTATAPKY